MGTSISGKESKTKPKKSPIRGGEAMKELQTKILSERYVSDTEKSREKELTSEIILSLSGELVRRDEEFLRTIQEDVEKLYEETGRQIRFVFVPDKKKIQENKRRYASGTIEERAISMGLAFIEQDAELFGKEFKTIRVVESNELVLRKKRDTTKVQKENTTSNSYLSIHEISVIPRLEFNDKIKTNHGEFLGFTLKGKPSVRKGSYASQGIFLRTVDEESSTITSILNKYVLKENETRMRYNRVLGGLTFTDKLKGDLDAFEGRFKERMISLVRYRVDGLKFEYSDSEVGSKEIYKIPNSLIDVNKKEVFWLISKKGTSEIEDWSENSEIPRE